MRKWGITDEGKPCGPIEPDRVVVDGYQWFNSEAERDAALPQPDQSDVLNERRMRASLTPMQFMLALEDMGLYDAVESFVNDSETPKKIKIMWAKASSFDRMNPELVQMAAAMNFTDEQLDAVFGITAGS